MNHVNVFAIHRCINEGYRFIQIFTEKIRISPTKLWRVCELVRVSLKLGLDLGFVVILMVRVKTWPT